MGRLNDEQSVDTLGGGATVDLSTTASGRRRGRERRRDPMLVLACTGESGSETRRAALRGDEVILGRGCSLFGGEALADPRMSRHHAALQRSGQGWFLRDLGSRNGSTRNGQTVAQPVLLQRGDVLRFGDTVLVFTLDDPQAELPEDELLVGWSAPIREVREDVDAVAHEPITVLLSGETGTGKEVVARALHERSGRSGRFVAVNCAALSENLLESELFGHVRGAFTGATEDREGLVRAASGGTLFLDEAGDMPASVQAGLLRVLESGEVRPVGSTRSFSVEVRIVAATNRILTEDVEAGRFRLDLYGRLSQWSMHLPPLRARREDIPLLAAHLLGELGEAPRPVGASLMEALLGHHWPLNVRGLRSVLKVAVIDSPKRGALRLGRRVEAALEKDRSLGSPSLPEQTPPAPGRPRGARPPKDALEDAFARHAGSVAAVAREHGATRQQVYRWVEHYGLDPAAWRG